MKDKNDRRHIIEDIFRDPTEVWKAVEGDPTELIELLRSDKRLAKPVRKALADYFEGTLQPVKRPQGRPSKEQIQPFVVRASRAITYWHDPTTRLGYVGFRYERLRNYIRKRGWHKKSAGKFYWSPDRLREAVAERYGLTLETLENYLRRPREKPPMLDPDYEAWNRRLKIADEIHRKKKRDNS